MSECERDKIPDKLDDAIDHLEAGLSKEIAAVEADTPDPLAPVGEQIAHALRAKRLEADGEFIDELRHHGESILEETRREQEE